MSTKLFLVLLLCAVLLTTPSLGGDHPRPPQYDHKRPPKHNTPTLESRVIPDKPYPRPYLKHNTPTLESRIIPDKPPNEPYP
ncbi:hypothetical protein LguiB_014160 [Lonicera macranthoides]